jgi:hypothetical protein
MKKLLELCRIWDDMYLPNYSSTLERAQGIEGFLWMKVADNKTVVPAIVQQVGGPAHLVAVHHGPVSGAHDSASHLPRNHW